MDKQKKTLEIFEHKFCIFNFSFPTFSLIYFDILYWFFLPITNKMNWYVNSANLVGDKCLGVICSMSGVTCFLVVHISFQDLRIMADLTGGRVEYVTAFHRRPEDSC